MVISEAFCYYFISILSRPSRYDFFQITESKSAKALKITGKQPALVSFPFKFLSYTL